MSRGLQIDHTDYKYSVKEVNMLLPCEDIVFVNVPYFMEEREPCLLLPLTIQDSVTPRRRSSVLREEGGEGVVRKSSVPSPSFPPTL